MTIQKNKKGAFPLGASVLLIGVFLVLVFVFDIFGTASILSQNLDYKKQLTSGSETALVKSSRMIDQIENSGNSFVKQTFNQQDSFSGNGMILDLFSTSQKLAGQGSVSSGKIETIVVTENKNLDFNQIQSISFDYTISHEVQGNIHYQSNQIAEEPYRNANQISAIMKLGLTNSKRDIVGVEKNANLYSPSDFSNTPISSSGTFTLDTSKTNIETDEPYEIFIYGKLNEGNFDGATQKLRIDLTNIVITKKTGEIIEVTTQAPITNEVQNSEVIIENKNFFQKFWDWLRGIFK